MQFAPLPQNADELVRAEVESQTKKLANFGDITASDKVVKKGRQTFAVFVHIAREIEDFFAEEEDQWVKVAPALLNGQAFESCPEEGSIEVLHWVMGSRKQEWYLDWIRTGWIYTKELDLSPAEISDNIAEEIMRGETPLTPSLPGWA